MSITSNVNSQRIIGDILYHNKDIVDQLAREIILNMAGGTDEMVADCQEEYADKQSIDRAFGGLREQSIDYLTDFIEDFRTALLDKITSIEYTAKVRKIEYAADDSISDVEVNIAFE